MGSKYSGSNLQGEGYIRNCNLYRTIRLLEHGMMMVERVLDKSFSKLVTVDEL